MDNRNQCKYFVNYKVLYTKHAHIYYTRRYIWCIPYTLYSALLFKMF